MHRTKLNEALSLAQKYLDSSSDLYRVVETEWVQIDRALRFYIDFKDSSKSFGMEDCVKISKILNEVPEFDLLVQGEYNLEVSSPGIERPLRLHEDFLAACGKIVKVRVSGMIDGKRGETGELVFLKDDLFAIKTLAGLWSFKLESLHSGKLVYEWDIEQ